MSRYDEPATTVSVLADKSALDPRSKPDEIVRRTDQKRALATILTDVEEGYLPTTVSVYGPPSTGRRKTR